MPPEADIVAPAAKEHWKAKQKREREEALRFAQNLINEVKGANK